MAAVERLRVWRGRRAAVMVLLQVQALPALSSALVPLLGSIANVIFCLSKNRMVNQSSIS